ncbi:MAG: 50S ribosomal protein L6 [Nanoarchaeota archaeon]
MKIDITEQIPLPSGVSATYTNGLLSIKGLHGENKRIFTKPNIHLNIEDTTIKIYTKQGTKKEKTMLYSTLAHIKNMIKGVQDLFRYELKICNGHFPMNITLQGNVLLVKNFLGEKIPRKVTISSGVKVTLAGDKINIESIDIECAGKTASDIEQICRISNRDRRIFQDGIYITKKCGEAV